MIKKLFGCLAIFVWEHYNIDSSIRPIFRIIYIIAMKLKLYEFIE